MANGRTKKKTEVMDNETAIAGRRSWTPVPAPGLGEVPVIEVSGEPFDLEDPRFPEALEDRALASGGYPYKEKLDKTVYARELEALQIELVKAQRHVANAGLRVIALFEGRDAAGKGGTIGAIRQYMNPRSARIVALPRPTEAERGQWYFQRYVDQFPTRGEFVLFDRSWYNRAGVEQVMGFCTPEEYRHFLKATKEFEDMLVKDGIILLKYWIDIGREMQLKRFHDRRHDPLKIWKLSPMDVKALTMFDDYTAARDRMLRETHMKSSPWIIARANDKRRARLDVIRHLLGRIDYPDKDARAIGTIDAQILGSGPKFLGLGKG
ncbi:polyphosphate kinase 2 [Methylobrevis pamukkalensis]|uniref:ADP/GDP-polyphosphate phosphotransferase n=1 Tax=Methylobrevis pamukkalensis TaxID=1439726 RepID=A0A1E3H0I0_9HYPH|nr:polyphosphate kinase 2 [Methylobrevis pamukkalensis]ODN69819.1 Polyphosphate kinase 2 (PPK2) [Methylobrevis pamukkalensis]